MKQSKPEIVLKRIIPILLVVYLIFLVVFGVRYHVLESLGPEFDDYTGKADELRAGTLPRDPYRPLLYPLLTAAAGEIFNDTFAGGRFVSTLCACLFVMFTWMTGRRVFGEPAASIAVLLLMLNFHVATFGMSVSTDMTFAALLSALIYFSLMAAGRPGGGLALIVGFLFAAAFFTRYSAAFILPVPVVAIMINRGNRNTDRGLKLAALFLISALIILVPHFVLNTKVFGSPLYNENWKNLAFKLYGNKDWDYFGRIQFNGLYDVIRSDPSRWLRSSASEFARSFSSTLYYLGGKGAAGFLFIALGLAGLAAMIRRMDRYRFIMLLTILLLAAGGALTFFSGVRFLLPVLGLYYLAIAELAAGRGRLARLRRCSAAPIVSLSLLIALVIATIHTGIRHLDYFIQDHRVEELEAAKMLEHEHGDGIVVLGTFPLMQRHVSYRYLQLELPAGGERMSSGSYVDRMLEQVRMEKADFVIIARALRPAKPPEPPANEAAPLFLSAWHSGERVTVYRVVTRPAD